MAKEAGSLEGIGVVEPDLAHVVARTGAVEPDFLQRGAIVAVFDGRVWLKPGMKACFLHSGGPFDVLATF